MYGPNNSVKGVSRGSGLSYLCRSLTHSYAGIDHQDALGMQRRRFILGFSYGTGSVDGTAQLRQRVCRWYSGDRERPLFEWVSSLNLSICCMTVERKAHGRGEGRS
jgi:hypothetical protein